MPVSTAQQHDVLIVVAWLSLIAVIAMAASWLGWRLHQRRRRRSHWTQAQEQAARDELARRMWRYHHAHPPDDPDDNTS